MEPVGDDADRAGRIPERELRERDRQVEDENANEDAVDRGVTAWQGDARTYFGVLGFYGFSEF